MEQQYNLRSPAVKRIMREARELRDPTHQYHAQPLEDNLFEWHFTVAGASDSVFDGGRYHGRIMLPSEYPMKPPHIIILTHNGRFIVGHKICLSVSGHHPESWQPSWSIRTVLLALIGFMPTKGEGAIGALEYPDKERTRLAKQSVDYMCPTCGVRAGDALPSRKEGEPVSSKEDEELAAQISFKGAKSNSQSADAQKTGGANAAARDGAGAGVSLPADAAAAGGSEEANAAESSNQVRQRGSRKAARITELPPPAAESTGWVWTVLIWLLVLAFVALAVRRLFFL